MILVFLFISLPALAGEQPSVHLTGNANVDFFGSRISPDNRLGVMSDSSLPEMMLASPNLEKSPWLAGALSLVVPGLGEVYTKNYLKAAAFFAADVGSLFLAYTYNKKGDRQTDEFQLFANQHYSVVRYANWTVRHLTALNPTIANDSNYYWGRIYDGDPPLPEESHPPFHNVNWAELNALERQVAASPSPNGYTHVLPYYNEQQYFELIGKYPEFSRGWDDSDPNSPLENILPIQSTSARFFIYANMRAQANHYYDLAGTWLSIAVINHILSAADAFWSATRYNSALHAEINMQVIPTQYGFVPYTEAKVRFDF
jgi:hypothetical protein